MDGKEIANAKAQCEVLSRTNSCQLTKGQLSVNKVVDMYFNDNDCEDLKIKFVAIS